MEPVKSPCMTCTLRTRDKDRDVCMQCDRRVAYVRALAGDEYDKNRADKMEVVMTTGKQCKKCGQVKPLTEFARNDGCRDGHEGQCKACRLAAQKARRKAKVGATGGRPAIETGGSPALTANAVNLRPAPPEISHLLSRSDTQALIAEECDALKIMLLQKNAEYGDSAVNPLRLFSTAPATEQIKVRIDDKISRLRNQGEKAIAEDTVLDLIGYLVLLRVAQRQAGERK